MKRIKNWHNQVIMMNNIIRHNQNFKINFVKILENC